MKKKDKDVKANSEFSKSEDGKKIEMEKDKSTITKSQDDKQLEAIPERPKTIEQKYQDALSEIEELKKNRMFLQAEMENSQKIADKRIENSKYNIKVDVIRNFFPIVDSFEAAISKYESNSKKDYEQLLEGIKSLQKQFLQVLGGLGIKPIESIGIPFNYKEHDVFMRLVDEEYPEDTVIKIAQKGYYLGDNVLRPAKVIVSKKKEHFNAIPVESEEITTEKKDLDLNTNSSETKESESQTTANIAQKHPKDYS